MAEWRLSVTELCRIAIDPVAKPRMTQKDKWARRPAVVRYRDYCDELRAAVREAGVIVFPESCWLQFVLPAPTSWSKRKRARMCGEPHRQKPDTDNLVKGVLDAMLDDDSVVWRVLAEKGWGTIGSVTIGEVRMS